MCRFNDKWFPTLIHLNQLCYTYGPVKDSVKRSNFPSQLTPAILQSLCQTSPDQMQFSRFPDFKFGGFVSFTSEILSGLFYFFVLIHICPTLNEINSTQRHFSECCHPSKVGFSSGFGHKMFPYFSFSNFYELSLSSDGLDIISDCQEVFHKVF